MKSRISLLLLLILLICTISGNIFSATLEVGTGKTYSTIQTAIDAASSGDTILVYPGTYTENINLSDGITVESSGTASETIIDGNTSGTVVIMDNDSTIDGFTIQNGSGTNAGGGTYIGGGIVAYLKVNVTIQNCVITSNSITGATTAMGGGIWAQDTSNSTLSNCTISNNEISGSGSNNLGGGALLQQNTGTSSWIVTDCVFDSNTAIDNGGGLFVSGTTTLIGCTISNNTCKNGSGIAMGNTTILDRCTISGNTNNSAGSTTGVIACSPGSTTTATNCLITNNTNTTSSQTISPAISSENIIITNSTFAGNSCKTASLSFDRDSGSKVTSVTNCIIADTCPYSILDESATYASTITNNDLYAATTAPYGIGSSSITSYTLAQLNAFSTASGNIDDDPLFVGSSDYHLQTGSPCIDAGTSSGAPSTDLDGTSRPQGSGYDIGCYEYLLTLTSPTGSEYWEAGSTQAITWSASEGITNVKLEYSIDNGSSWTTITSSTTASAGSYSWTIPDLTATQVLVKVSDTSYATVYDQSATSFSFARISWYFAEGATGSAKNFSEWLLLLNPNSTTANVTLTFFKADGTTVTSTDTVDANSRKTINVNSLSGLSDISELGAKIESTNNVDIFADRSLYWNSGDYTWAGGHCTVGASVTATTWYLAEGCTSGFDQYLLLLNPNDSTAEVTITYFKEDGTTVTATDTIAATSRKTINVNNNADTADLCGVAAKVESTNEVGIVVERSLYWNENDNAWIGGTCSIAAQAAATTWYFAEGSTNGFDQYLLLLNPNDSAAEVTITYFKEDGTTVTATDTVAATSRKSIRVNDNSALTDLSGLATKVESTNSVGIIAERSMYWTSETALEDNTASLGWTGGHCSIGTSSTAASWYLAEGSTDNFDEYLLLLNPNDSTAEITITYFAEDGTTVTATDSVAATARKTIHVNSNSALADVPVTAAKLESTNSVGVVVERTMYHNSDAASRLDGTCTIGKK